MLVHDSGRFPRLLWCRHDFRLEGHDIYDNSFDITCCKCGRSENRYGHELPKGIWVKPWTDGIIR